MNICRTCEQDFESLAAFDEHRTGTYAYTYSQGLEQEPMVEDGRRCFSVTELQEFGWSKNKDGRWCYPHDWVKQAWKWDALAEAVR